MSEERWERRLEALFSDSIPEPDPLQSIESTGQPEDSGAEASRRLPDQAPPAALPDREVQRPGTLSRLFIASVLGEAAATAVLLIVLYRYTPRSLRDLRLLLTSAAFACMTLVLLFVQWQLGKRLSRVEQLVQRRNKQLNQAFTVLQKRQKQIELANEVVRRQDTTFGLCAQIGWLTAQGLDLEEFSNQVVARVQQHFDPSFVGLFLLDAGQKEVTLLAAAGSRAEATLSRLGKLAMSDSTLLRECIERRQARVVADVEALDQAGGEQARDLLLVTQMGSVMIVPVTGPKRALGGITVQSDEPHFFRKKDAALLMLVADLAASVIARTRRRRKARVLTSEREAGDDG